MFVYVLYFTFSILLYSTEMSKQFSSLIWDYVVFAILLSASTIYPLWQDRVGGKGGRTKANFVFAAGGVSMLPMMLSIARGTLGVRAFLGNVKYNCVSKPCTTHFVYCYRQTQTK